MTGLEANAEAWERKEMGDARKAEEADRRAQEAKRRDKEERDALKGKIVGRYADEVKVLLVLYRRFSLFYIFSFASVLLQVCISNPYFV